MLSSLSFLECDDSVSSAGLLGNCTVDRGKALDRFDSNVFTMSYFSGLFLGR